MSSITKRDVPLLWIQTIVWIFMLAAAAFSTMHIVETGHALGLGWESYFAPMFVDGIAIVGKLSMLPRWTKKFRRSGFVLLMIGGLLSLSANIYAGDSLGSRGFGVLVVAGFMLLESHLTKANRDDAIAPPAPEVTPKVSAKLTEAEKSARKRAGYDKMDKAGKMAFSKSYRAKAAKREERELAEMAAGFVPANAPVSPAAV
jgi:hypothetical protein